MKIRNGDQLMAVCAAALLLSACAGATDDPVSIGFGAEPELGKPQSSLLPTIKVADAVGWKDGEAPTPVAGLRVNAFATGLDHPRWMHVLPNGDVLVAETNGPADAGKGKGIRGFFEGLIMGQAGAKAPSADRITLLRDADGDGAAETRSVLVGNLYSPFGMALVGDTLFVANTDAVIGFPYQAGATRIEAAGVKLTDLPGGELNHHWTKNILASLDGAKLYATAGSNSNIGEFGLDKEEGRAAIWEIDIASGDKRLFATGLRNPNGLAWEPATGALWTSVNERDELGHNLVPDYITSVRDGAFYGWPWSYYGKTVDTRVKPARPDMVEKAVAPDFGVGAHTASLGLTFAEDAGLGATFSNGVFIGQHGSWNRNPPSGYKVVFVPFSGGRPAGDPVDVLTGFLVDGKASGRPVGVEIASDGALLVADDVGNAIWRVSAAR